MPRVKYKSKMKEFYEKAGIPVARYHLVNEKAAAFEFAHKVGYPVVAKPDNGVGASHTFKISNDEEMENFFNFKWPDTEYIMEEFVRGEVNSYDAIIDSEGNPMFETGNCTPFSIMDIVNNNDNSLFYIKKKLESDTKKYGRATVKSFGVKSRFVHLEFFRLQEDQEGLGKKGELVGLEVNMRPSGGVTPDMINYAHSTDVYKIWADMIAFDRSTMPQGDHAYCAFAGLRDGKNFKMNHYDIMNRYGSHIRMAERVSEALSGAMGNQMYLATFDTLDELNGFFKDVTETWD